MAMKKYIRFILEIVWSNLGIGAQVRCISTAQEKINEQSKIDRRRESSAFVPNLQYITYQERKLISVQVYKQCKSPEEKGSRVD